MDQLTEFLERLTWPGVALVLGIPILPIVAWRLLRSPSGSVWVAKWGPRIEQATDRLESASKYMDDLALRMAKSRIAELEIASRSAFLPDKSLDRQKLEDEIGELAAIVRSIEEQKL